MHLVIIMNYERKREKMEGRKDRKRKGNVKKTSSQRKTSVRNRESWRPVIQLLNFR